MQIGDTTTFVIALKQLSDAQPFDLTGATAREIRLRKPNGTVVVKAATVDGDPTDGRIKWQAGATDIDLHGLWLIQGKVTNPSGILSTPAASFLVQPNLEVAP